MVCLGGSVTLSADAWGSLGGAAVWRLPLAQGAAPNCCATQGSPCVGT